jgi:glycosyltransferase involved in cell wall biosynthesis
MRKVEIKDDLNNINEGFCYKNLIIIIITLFIESDIKGFKFFLFVSISFTFIGIIIFDIYYNEKVICPNEFKKYIKDCKNSIIYDRDKIYNKNPYLSICISLLNMENYIYQNLISILNQSFQDFEIIVINDNSTDNTEAIIKNIQLDDDRIKLISHSKNLGLYFSKIESIFNSKGKFILMIGPDGMLLNGNIFQELYNFNSKKNLDIIEFSVFNQIENRKNIFFANSDFDNHYHKFDKLIIYQPELSNILFHKPGTLDNTNIICKSTFNKMIRKEVLIQTDVYLRNEYKHKYIIINEDSIINVISYQLAKNYTNINLPGYLNIFKRRRERDNTNNNLNQIKLMNLNLYLNIFFKYIKDFNKDKNLLIFEMKNMNNFFLKIKESNETEISLNQIYLIEQILKDKILTNESREYLNNLLIYFKN